MTIYRFRAITLSLTDIKVLFTDVLRCTIQIDTKDILFICGGAFVDLEKTIVDR